MKWLMLAASLALALTCTQSSVTGPDGTTHFCQTCCNGTGYCWTTCL